MAAFIPYKKAREFQKDIYFWVDHNKLWKILKEMGIPDHPYLSAEKPVCKSKINS